MERQGMTIPLLIGGATTSLIHTSVKIDPAYSGPTVYVPDASRAVGVASTLLSVTQRDDYVVQIKQEYQAARQRREAQQQGRDLVSMEQARANRTPIDWRAYTPPVPRHPGIQVLEDIPLSLLIPYIDWTFFFHAWELKGRYPAILEDVAKGKEARRLMRDAEAMLLQITEQKWLRAAAVTGLFPANAVQEDVILYKDDAREQVLTQFHFLRKQGRQPSGRYNECLADYIAPRDSAVADYLGAFACTAGLGIERRLEQFEADHDDYSAIMLKALADRLAEALAEWLHQQMRRETWGYAATEQLDNDQLIKERYQGIRPAFGYPACPDHSEKDLLWALLEVEERTGIWLTEAKAMVPTAAVSGLYFSHPQSRYFAVGKIDRAQVADYSRRKGVETAEMERWLAPNLAYDPA
jgi:5-methyltetrahydrofolate--homocysteine methyltransferase